MDLYDEDPDEIEYYERNSDHICSECGRVMDYEIVTDEVYGALSDRREYYCPYCD